MIYVQKDHMHAMSYRNTSCSLELVPALFFYHGQKEGKEREIDVFDVWTFA
jgi:hypothetical protein